MLCLIIKKGKVIFLYSIHERMSMMKKLLALLLAAMLGASLAVCLTSCDDEEKTGSEVGEIVGGWSNPDSVKVTDDAANALKKATEKLAGGTYEPIACLATQVVAGTNYRLLCTFTPATEGADASYTIVTVYEDLEGNAEITEVLTSDAKVNVTKEAIDGGWVAPENPDVTEEAGKALQASVANLVGAQYNPVALLGTQVVAGTNYCLLCEVTPVVENPETHYSVVTVYEGTDGTTSVVETFDFAPEATE